MAFTEAPGAQGTVNGFTVKRSFESTISAGDIQVVPVIAGRSIAVQGAFISASTNNMTVQFFSGDPGSGGTAIGEPFRVDTTGAALAPSPYVIAFTQSGEALWITISGAGTIDMDVFHTRSAT